MGQLSKLNDILDAVKEDCVAAWELQAATIVFGRDRLPRKTAPAVNLYLIEVPISGLAVRSVLVDLSIDIHARFKFPDTGNVLLDALQKADDLTTVLITGPTYKGLAFSPMVTALSFDEGEQPSDSTYEFTLTFSCKYESEMWAGATVG